MLRAFGDLSVRVRAIGCAGGTGRVRGRMKALANQIGKATEESGSQIVQARRRHGRRSAPSKGPSRQAPSNSAVRSITSLRA